MDEDKSIAERIRDARGKAIIDGKDYREDSYTNMMTKVGTSQDSSTAYRYKQESITTDSELIRLYEGNGLFTKIIDRPAEEAVKHGLDIDYGDEDITEYIEQRFDELDFEEKFATAEKWARLYGGSIIVMLVDDGGALEDPLDWKRVRRIAELRVFERAIVQADYTGLYNFNFEDSMRLPYGQPEYYHVFSVYGSFTVHYTRCLVFRNGRVPEQTTNSIYRYWGIPEYEKIKKALRECITSHEDGVRLLERSVQAIYKMRNLSNLLATDEGEDKVLQRLLGIDTSRNIINTMAIDADGEDYDFKTLPMTGVKDITDMTCNMLSAVTGIPQTVLFGRSPAGENATGQSDFENYYNMIENIQKQNMKKNVRTLIDLILIQGQLEGRIEKIPNYKVKFAPLWSLSEQEQVAVDLQKAQIKQTRAAVAQSYVDMQVLDPTEIRNILAKEGDFDIEEVMNPDEDLNIPEDAWNIGDDEEATQPTPDEEKLATESSEQEETPQADAAEQLAQQALDHVRGDASSEGDIDKGVGVLVIKDGYILCGQRSDGKGYAGPGGHMKAGETAEQAAIRETREEFGITPLNLIPIGNYVADSDEYDDAVQFLATDYEGEVFPADHEMFGIGWMTMQELADKPKFEPFEMSLEGLIKLLNNDGHNGNLNEDGAPYGNQNAAGPHKRSKDKEEPALKEESSSSETNQSKISHFKTENGTMHITEDTEVTLNKTKRTKVTIKAGEDIVGIYTFAGKGTNNTLVKAGSLTKQHPESDIKGWAHNCGFGNVVDAQGNTRYVEIHWFEHDAVGQVGFKVKRR